MTPPNVTGVKFEHLKLVYPQISNVADKIFLAMIKFKYDLDDVREEIRLHLHSEIRKIMDHP